MIIKKCKHNWYPVNIKELITDTESDLVGCYDNCDEENRFPRKVYWVCKICGVHKITDSKEIKRRSNNEI